MTAGEFITKLATMAGVSAQDQSLVDILSSSEFANYKIPDAVTEKITSNLLTMGAAQNNENLRKYFHAEIYDGLDDNLNNIINKYGLDPEISDAIKAEKKTTQKYNTLIEKMTELQTKKANAQGNKAKNEVEAEIQTLNNQIKDLTTKLQQAPIERDQFWSDKLRNKAIQNTLAGYQYANEKDIPRDVLMETAQILLNKKLAEGNMKLQYDPEKDIISLKTESGLDYYKDNSPVSFKSFADAVLSESKLLSIPGSQAPISTAANTTTAANQTILQANGKTTDASKFFAAIDDIAAGRF